MPIIERFNPADHTTAEHRYSQTHIVVGALPLKEIVFNPSDDTVAEFIGRRHPERCPQFEELSATPDRPLIKGLEAKQHLIVSCLARVQVLATDGVTSHGMCSIKIQNARMDVDLLPDALLGSEGLRCPFSYLEGTVSVPDENGVVDVALDAYNPTEDPHGPTLHYSH